MRPGSSTSSGDSPFASTHGLDTKVCGEVGTRLGRTRGERGWTHADVANRLMLSTAQVSGLERADASAFHSPAFFAAGLRKYATLMGTSCPETILVPKTTTVVRAAPASESTVESKTDSDTSRFPVPMLWVAVATVVLVAGALVLALYFRGRSEGATLPAPLPEGRSEDRPLRRLETLPGEATLPEALPAPPSVPIAASPAPTLATAPAATAPAPIPAAVAPSPAAPPVPPAAAGRAGVVTLAQPAWVFVRYGDNTITERVLQAGQSLTLSSPPIYLAIGTADGVTLTLRGQEIDVSPFRNGDEIRIRANELAALAR